MYHRTACPVKQKFCTAFAAWCELSAARPRCFDVSHKQREPGGGRRVKSVRFDCTLLAGVVYYNKISIGPAAAGREVLHMKSLLKLLVLFAALAGVCCLVLSWLEQNNDEDYISIYGGPEEAL